ncbi:MAG: thrombospondin type 3 repeat-containing protein [Poseidonia sp.]
MTLVFLLTLCLLAPASAQGNESPTCVEGTSTEDRLGCLDSDGDGWSDPDEGWNASMGADAFPDNATEHRDLDGDGIGDVADPDMDGDGSPDDVDVWPEDNGVWSDTDGDGYADQGLHALSDNCPNIYGKSKIRLLGCSDIDGDFLPDEYDDDADGDGIRNEMERSASSGTILYDPYNPDSTPPDADQDTIPDVLDPDNDNDGWPDYIEIDRGSNIYDDKETPFTMYFGTNTGIFYTGGLGPGSFSFEFDNDYTEISVSVVSEIVFEELVIPLLLIPIYFAIFISRRREFNRLLKEIETAKSSEVLLEIESEVNESVKQRNIKVYHGLVLRNAIEVAEGRFGGDHVEEE